jgi:hypothetical protein
MAALTANRKTVCKLLCAFDNCWGCHQATQRRQIWQRPLHFAPPAGAASTVHLGAGLK